MEEILETSKVNKLISIKFILVQQVVIYATLFAWFGIMNIGMWINLMKWLVLGYGVVNVGTKFAPKKSCV